MKAKDAREKLNTLEGNVARVIRGKDDLIRNAIIGMLAHGHVLFEDVPGVGKTTLAQCLARSLGLTFQRVQFTSDMLPSDILGVTIFDPARREFEFRAGPIFANIVLVDEINRTTPKTQSALLEAMNSAQVSIDKTTHDLPQPFMVIATQNPVESHGTFPLPTSQLDRFLLRLHLGYPEAEFEREILRNPRRHNDVSMIRPVLDGADLIQMQGAVNEVSIDDSIVDYIVRLSRMTRESSRIGVGVSTRGALALRRCAQAHAYLNGRDFCTPDDVKAMAVPVLAHRIVPAGNLNGENGSIGAGTVQIREILDQVAVPV